MKKLVSIVLCLILLVGIVVSCSKKEEKAEETEKAKETEKAEETEKAKETEKAEETEKAKETEKAEEATEDKSGDEEIVIAVVPKALDNAVFLDTKQAAEEKAAELGFSLIWTASQKSDAAEQVNVIEGLIEKKVDGMLISCNDADALKDVIDRAVDAGIVVATFDSDSPESKRNFYIGTNNYTLGEVSAQKMMEYLPDGGKIAILTGVPGMPNLETRIEGFTDTAAGSNLEILPVQAGDCDTQKSVDVITQFTLANPDLAGWWLVGVWPTLADPEAIPELANFSDKGGVTVSVDAVWPQLAYVERGIIDVLVGQDFSAMGSQGVDALYKLIKNEEVDLGGDEKYIDTGYILVDENNIEEIKAVTPEW